MPRPPWRNRRARQLCGLPRDLDDIAKPAQQRMRHLVQGAGGIGGKPAASFVISRFEDVWDAVRHFFQHQAAGCKPQEPDTACRTTHVNKQWRELLPRIEELAMRAGLQVQPGRFRSRTRKLHDGNRGIRLAGAHASLVVRRTLHQSAHPASNGALAPVRSRVSGQPRPRLPCRRKHPGGERAGDRACAGACRFLAQQHAVPQQPAASGRSHRRTGGVPRAANHHGGRGTWSAESGIGPRRGARARTAHRRRSARAAGTISRISRRPTRRRRTMPSASDLPPWIRQRRARLQDRS